MVQTTTATRKDRRRIDQGQMNYESQKDLLHNNSVLWRNIRTFFINNLRAMSICLAHMSGHCRY
jgi:hypothetical protein